jgi:exportin-T
MTSCSPALEVRFFALQALQESLDSLARYEQLSPDMRLGLRKTLMDWISLRFGSPNTSASVEPSFLKNKLAHLLVSLVRRQYPNEWPSFFRDLLQLVSTGSVAMLDLYLRICVSLDQEVVCRYIHRTQEDLNLNTMIVSQRSGSTCNIYRKIQ